MRQQGQTYLQRSQAFMQSKMGFLSGGVMQYLFAVTPDYGEGGLALLLRSCLNFTNLERQSSNFLLYSVAAFLQWGQSF